MFKGMDLKNEFLENINFENVYYQFFIKIILMKIQGQKIYLLEANLLDIESIYKDHPEITCRFLIEENQIINLRDKIKEALQNYPKLSGLDFDVNIPELEKEENNKKNTILKSNDKIYFDLNLKEVWLNVDLSLTELTEFGEIIDLEKNKKENIIKINLDIKIKRPISEKELNDILLNTSIEILGYRGENNNKEEDENKNELENIKENNDIDYYLFCNFKFDKNIDNTKNINRIRSKSIKTKRKINEDNNIIINNNNNSNDKMILIQNKNNSKEKRIEMSDMSENNKKMVTINANDNEKKINSNIKKEPSEINFNINDKITCNLTYINFTNYILKDEDFTKDSQNRAESKTKDKDISIIKKLFNQNFDKFYNTIPLDNQTKIVKEKKLIYLQYFKEKIDVNKSNNDKPEKTNDTNESKIKDEEALLNSFKNINYNEKIKNLNPYIFKEDFKRVTQISENIRYNKSIFNEEIEPINDKVNERKSILIVEEKLNNNFENNNNLQKKAILVIIFIILVIIILIKIY